MPWKSTAPLIVGLAAAAAGYVWFKRSERGTRPALGTTDETPASGALDDVESGAGLPRDIWRDTEIPPASGQAVRADALHDLRLADRAEPSSEFEEDVDLSVFNSEPDTWEEEIDPNAVFELPESVHSSDHVLPAEETYDAIDTEDIGAEWLRRATEAGGPQTRSTDEMLEGTQIVIDMNDSALDEADIPLVVEVTEELPLGAFDRAGAAEWPTELASRIGRRDAASELSPNEEELAGRSAVNDTPRRSQRKHRD